MVRTTPIGIAINTLFLDNCTVGYIALGISCQLSWMTLWYLSVPFSWVTWNCMGVSLVFSSSWVKVTGHVFFLRLTPEDGEHGRIRSYMGASIHKGNTHCTHTRAPARTHSSRLHTVVLKVQYSHAVVFQARVNMKHELTNAMRYTSKYTQDILKMQTKLEIKGAICKASRRTPQDQCSILKHVK